MSHISSSRLAASLLGALTLARPVFAAPDVGLDKTAETAGYNVKANVGISETIGRIVAPLTGLLGTLFVLLMIYGGWLWLTAQGDTKQIGKAKEVIFNAVIGLVIILSAYAITNFVLDAATTAI